MNETKDTHLNGGATANRHREETDHAPRLESSEFKVQPATEESASNSLTRNAQKYFHRQTMTSPQRPLHSLQESDVEAAQGAQFEVVLQAPNKPNSDTTMTTPPAQRPPTLLPLKQDSTEFTQQ